MQSANSMARRRPYDGAPMVEGLVRKALRADDVLDRKTAYLRELLYGPPPPPDTSPLDPATAARELRSILRAERREEREVELAQDEQETDGSVGDLADAATWDFNLVRAREREAALAARAGSIEARVAAGSDGPAARIADLQKQQADLQAEIDRLSAQAAQEVAPAGE